MARVSSAAAKGQHVDRAESGEVALQMGLTPVLMAMARRHPRLTTEIITDDALVDVVEGGFDAGIRLGEMIAQDMVAVRLTPACRAIFARSLKDSQGLVRKNRSAFITGTD